MSEYLLALLAVVVAGLLLVAVPKLVAVWLLSRKARADQPDSDADGD